MFTATWAAIIIANGVPVNFVQMIETQAYADRAACDASIKDHAARMPDMVRGHLGAPWSVEIKVAGACEPKGDPA